MVLKPPLDGDHHVLRLGVSLLTVAHCTVYSLHYNKSHLTHCIALRGGHGLSHYSLHLVQNQPHCWTHCLNHCHLEPFTAADLGSLWISQPFTAANQGDLLSYWYHWSFNFLNDFKRLPGASAVDLGYSRSSDVIRIFINCFKRLPRTVNVMDEVSAVGMQCYNITPPAVEQEPSGIGSVCLLLGEFSSPNPEYSIFGVCPFLRCPYCSYSIAPLCSSVNLFLTK